MKTLQLFSCRVFAYLKSRTVGEKLNENACTEYNVDSYAVLS
jgi:hypothetical protein